MNAGKEGEMYNQGYMDCYNDGENAHIDPDYWTRLEHTYAGMAMQGILGNPESELDYNDDETFPQALAGCAAKLAHALVEKYKKEEKIKDIYEDADKNWNHGYGLLKYLDENNDLQESRTDYSTVISYAMDAVRMLDDIKSIIEKEEK